MMSKIGIYPKFSYPTSPSSKYYSRTFHCGMIVSDILRQNHLIVHRRQPIPLSKKLTSPPRIALKRRGNRSLTTSYAATEKRDLN
ncbi:hypothetical protein XBJ1_1973 [Xenorhabdus bovienii SS-2004]|uniref:Uncharacterized protein n=1 Tax=Xenorhabdus bovienii (strain SS-2004) TaxID=406818 RepID=D3V2Y4_XENBS|nr:hypothetical protein XBJ1_1973 [Xenorhabdus bovienii SS-2004]